MADVEWLGSPEEHDYSAAFSFLSLTMHPSEAERLAALLEAHPIIDHHPAKDVLRAAGTDVLPKTNKHVAKNLKKIEKGDALSPVLLVRDAKAGRLIIADGYHRVSAVWHADEDALIPAKIIGR